MSDTVNFFPDLKRLINSLIGKICKAEPNAKSKHRLGKLGSLRSGKPINVFDGVGLTWSFYQVFRLNV